MLRQVQPIYGMSQLLYEAVVAEARPGDRVFDVGTSCGIHGILTTRTRADVLELDVNPKVVRATRDNARRNRVGDRLEPQAMIRVCSVSGDPWRRLCWRDEQIPYSVWARRGIFRLRALEWFRGGASTGRGLHDLERLQARGADVGALRRGTFLDTDFLQVWVPAPAGCAQRVTARVAEVWTLSAGITDFSHDKSPVLRYRPMRGEGPEETVKRTPKSGLRAEIVPDPCGT